MVPKGWEVKQLANLTTKISDGIHSTPTYVEKSDIYFINGNNLKNGSIVVSDGTKKVCPENAQNHRRDLSNRTILMSINGTIGNLAFYNNENVVLGKSACYINVTNNVDIKYIYYTLNSSKTQNFYTTELTGSTIKNLSLKTIKSTKILTPPLPEQQKIANILSTWDKAISTTERLIENSTQQKKALMQQLLTGKNRLLDESGKRFAGEWDKKALAGVCSKTISYGIVQTGEHVEDGIPCVRVVDLTKNIMSKNDMITTSNEVNQSYSKTILESDEVMMALRGVVGLVRLVNEGLVGSNITRGIARLAPKTELIQPDFFLWVLRSSYVKNELMKKVGGSALQEISLTALRKVKIPFPSLEEQQKIATVLINADKEIELLEQQLADLQQEKKALMQVLLTGKKRVVV